MTGNLKRERTKTGMTLTQLKEQVIIEKQREQKEKRSKWDEQQAAVDKVNKANNIAAKLNAEMASKIHPPNLMKGKS